MDHTACVTQGRKVAKVKQADRAPEHHGDHRTRILDGRVVSARKLRSWQSAQVTADRGLIWGSDSINGGSNPLKVKHAFTNVTIVQAAVYADPEC